MPALSVTSRLANSSTPSLPVIESPQYLDEVIVLFVLAGLYAILFLFPLIQFVRVRLRAPHIGWTTQKLFLLLTALAALIRTVFFTCLPWLRALPENFFLSSSDAVFTISLNIPRVILFTATLLLVLFWAEIIHRVKNQPFSQTRRLRPVFLIGNVLLYCLQATIWIVILAFPSAAKKIHIALIESLFFALLSLIAAVLFAIYGGQLFRMLSAFPIESAGRHSKLMEVALVSSVCFFGFLARAILLVVTCFVESADVNEWFLLAYYASVEVLPCAMVLIILHKLPPPQVPSVNSPLAVSSSIDDYSYGDYATADSGSESWGGVRRFSRKLPSDIANATPSANALW